MANVTYDKKITALVVIDPYNDFISEGGKFWDRLKGVADANQCVPHMLQILDAARKVKIRVFYALHRRYRPDDYETWKYIAPTQKAAWSHKAFENGTWGGEIRSEFEPQPGDIVALEPRPGLRRRLARCHIGWQVKSSTTRGRAHGYPAKCEPCGTEAYLVVRRRDAG